MKKKLLSGLLAGCLCLTLCLPFTAYADGQKVVTLGADLTEDQKTAVLKYFGVLGQNIKTLTITNQDERNHLGSYVPIEQIGTRTYSCALVNPTASGGIQVKTANLSWVTSNMIATTLSTSGVVNCDVLAASPFEVSGTGALTGIIMAYETASGNTLDPVKKELATQELITTGNIANEVGQEQATSIVNEIKIEVIQGQVVEPEKVEEIVDKVVAEKEQEVEVSLSDEDRDMLKDLMTQIADQQYDYDEMKDTLERVEENVESIDQNVDAINDKVDDLTQTEAAQTEAPAESESETEPETIDPDSILMNTDDSALGEGVTIDATAPEAVPETQPATETEPDAGFEITTSDSYSDSETSSSTETAETVPATEVPATDVPASETPAADDGYVDIMGGETAATDVPATETPASETPAADDGYVDIMGGETAVTDVPATEAPVSETPAADDGYVDIMGGETAYTETTEGAAEGETAAPAALTLGNYTFVPAASALNGEMGTNAAAGTSQVEILFADDNIVPVSGTLTVSDDMGNVYASVDLSNTAQVSRDVISETDRTNYCSGWTVNTGTSLLVNLGTALPASGSYTATVSAVVAQTADPSMLEGLPTAQVEMAHPFATDAYGVSVPVTDLQSTVAGSTLAGTVYFDANTGMASAAVSAYDQAMVSFDVTSFTPDAPAFNVTCLQPGTTQFTVDFYDANGTYLASTVYELTIR